MLTEEISSRVSKQLNLNEDLVNRIYRSQYKFLVDTMISGSLENVQLIYIGKFQKNKRGEKSFSDSRRMVEQVVPLQECGSDSQEKTKDM